MEILVFIAIICSFTSIFFVLDQDRKLLEENDPYKKYIEESCEFWQKTTQKTEEPKIIYQKERKEECKKCSYCGGNFIPDKRGNCSNCGGNDV